MMLRLRMVWGCDIRVDVCLLLLLLTGRCMRSGPRRLLIARLVLNGGVRLLSRLLDSSSVLVS